VFSELDHRAGQQLQGPACATLGRRGAGGRHQQCFLFARELTARSRARLLAKRRLQVAEHEALLGPIDGRAAHTDTGRDRIVADAGVGSQQNLRSLELARRMLASTQQCGEFAALGLAELDPIAYIHPCLLLVRGTDEQLNRMAGVSRSAKTFTPKQGQYLAFIHLYMRLHRRPPAETDMQQYFRVSPPSVHQMVLTLERAGFIKRQPRVARSIELLVDPEHLPELL
jgi:LexA DNA binding domain